MIMLIEPFEIAGLLKITPDKLTDSRGWFSEVYRADQFDSAVGAPVNFVQDNHSTSLKVGTVRGLHFQSPPFAQGKLVRCTRGAILDVAVDIRKGSPSYGRHAKLELSQENGLQLWVPPGFLHGFVSLEQETDVAYKCSAYYAPGYDGHVLWNDPDLAIDWGVSPKAAHLSEADQTAISFAAFDSPFSAS